MVSRDRIKKKNYAIALGIIALAVAFAGFMATSGFFFIPDKPSIIKVELYPEKATMKDVILITADIEDSHGIKYVEAEAQYNTGSDKILLELIEGDKKSGRYQGSWIIHEATGRKEITITALNINSRRSSASVLYEVQ